MELIEDAAYNLEARGYGELEDDVLPPELAAELLDLYRAGPCELCPGWPSPDNLAEHVITKWQVDYDRAAPVWVCDCGARFKCPAYWGNPEDFYHITDDGLVGDPVGGVKRDSKGKVKDSSVCPACGVRFADTIADRANPQQALF
jgi:hypothetical protein